MHDDARIPFPHQAADPGGNALVSLAGPVIVAVAIGVFAPLVFATPPAAGFVGASLIVLAISARALSVPGRRFQCPPLASGLVVLGLSSVLMVAPTLPIWLGASFTLCGAVLVGAGAVKLTTERELHASHLDELRGELARREEDVRAQAARIRRLDLIDQNSGLLNRTGFRRACERSLSLCEDAREPLMLLLVELPWAMPSNAEKARRAGHAARRAIRGSDEVGLLDKDRIAVLLPGCTEAEPVAQRLRRSFVEAGLVAENSLTIAGAGVDTEGPWPLEEDLIEAASTSLDMALRMPDRQRHSILAVDWEVASVTSTRPH